jgi:hypothetical protein
MSTTGQEMVLAHFIVSDNVERSRRFYTEFSGETASHLVARARCYQLRASMVRRFSPKEVAQRC